MNGERRLLGSFSHGSMANALPQAIGAQATFPDRQVNGTFLRSRRIPGRTRWRSEGRLCPRGATLIDVVTNRQELSMPPTIELKQELGFSLYMAKAVLNGRGDEIIDLAKTNLFR